MGRGGEGEFFAQTATAFLKTFCTSILQTAAREPSAHQPPKLQHENILHINPQNCSMKTSAHQPSKLHSLSSLKLINRECLKINVDLKTVSRTARPTCASLCPLRPAPRNVSLAKPDFGSQMPRVKAVPWLSCEGLGAARGCPWALVKEESPGCVSQSKP